MIKSFLTISIVLFLVACTPSPQVIQTAIAQTQSALIETLKYPSYSVGGPVETEGRALKIAQEYLPTEYNYRDPLIVIKIEQTIYGDYSKIIGESSELFSVDLKMWLVVFYNEAWRSLNTTISLDGTLLPPIQGCLTVAINAVDGSPFQLFVPLPPGKIPECD